MRGFFLPFTPGCERDQRQVDREEGLVGAWPTSEETMDSLTLIGLFGLTVVIGGAVAATFFAKRNDEMQSGSLEQD
jgi:hypothetical protein